METQPTDKIKSKDELNEFRFRDEWYIDGAYWPTWWPKEGTYNGYTKYEASQKAKAVYMSLKGKIWPGAFKLEPWLDSDYVMDIVRPGGEEAFREMVNEGGIKDDAGWAGYDWRLTN